ncbi:hypothetical protein FQR65_LT11452 [Abscondita terminalis]|nr:hypothetical protein FQR65_LT11452 [Abscondita terminalis]
MMSYNSKPSSHNPIWKAPVPAGAGGLQFKGFAGIRRIAAGGTVSELADTMEVLPSPDTALVCGRLLALGKIVVAGTGAKHGTDKMKRTSFSPTALPPPTRVRCDNLLSIASPITHNIINLKHPRVTLESPSPPRDSVLRPHRDDHVSPAKTLSDTREISHIGSDSPIVPLDGFYVGFHEPSSSAESSD